MKINDAVVIYYCGLPGIQNCHCLVQWYLHITAVADLEQIKGVDWDGVNWPMGQWSRGCTLVGFLGYKTRYGEK